jgi:hypothetical protein
MRGKGEGTSDHLRWCAIASGFPSGQRHGVTFNQPSDNRSPSLTGPKRGRFAAARIRDGVAQGAWVLLWRVPA